MGIFLRTRPRFLRPGLDFGFLGDVQLYEFFKPQNRLYPGPEDCLRRKAGLSRYSHPPLCVLERSER